MALFNQGLFRRGLFRAGLFTRGLWITLKSIFDRLQELDQPMVVAYEGQDSATTGHWPLEGNVVAMDGINGRIVAAPVISDKSEGECWFKLSIGATASLNYIFCGNASIGDGLLRVNVGGGLQIANSTASLIHSVSVTEDVWHHACWSIGGGEATMLELDGVNEVGAVSTNDEASAFYYIGVLYNLNSPFNGSFAYFRLGLTTYNLEESTGTTRYDSSGNGNHGTDSGGVTNVVDNTIPFATDRANLDGYTVGTGSNGAAIGVIIPRDGDTDLDVLGNALEFDESVYPVQPIRKGSVALVGDGIMYFDIPGLAGTETISSWSGTGPEPVISAGRMDLGVGTYSNIIINEGACWPLTECVEDIASEVKLGLASLQGTIISGTTGTQLTGSWGGTIDGLDKSLNLTNGFTLYKDAGTNYWRRPYDAAGLPTTATAPIGYTFVSENPAVIHPGGQYGHNGAETTEDSYNVSESGTPVVGTSNLANFDTIIFDDSNSHLISTVPIDSVYRRASSTISRDRLIAFYDSLTGTDKNLALKYTEGSAWDDLVIWDDPEEWAD